MQTIFENLGTKPLKRNYLSAFISFLMPIVWLFLPQLFEPLVMIKACIFGVAPSDAKYYTLEDVVLILYFGLGFLIGIFTMSFPNKKIPTIFFAILGILLNVSLLIFTHASTQIRVKYS